MWNSGGTVLLEVEVGGRGSEAEAVAVHAMVDGMAMMDAGETTRQSGQHCQSPWHGQTEVIFPPSRTPPSYGISVLAADSDADEQHMQNARSGD